MSDTSDFESADEDVPDTSQKKRHNSKGDKNKSTKNDKESLKTSTDDDKKIKEEKTEGWDDDNWDNFDIDDSQTMKQDVPNSSNVLKEDSDNEKWDDFNADEEKVNVQKNNNAQVKPIETKVSNDGNWDNFDGWDNNDDDDANRNQANSNRDDASKDSSAIHSEKEFKDLADRLSALGEANNSAENKPVWSGWGGWGVPNFITSGVSQISSHVSQGFATVSQVIETGMNVPEPEELALSQRKMSAMEKTKSENEPTESEKPDSTNSESNEPSSENISQKEDDSLGVFKIGKFVSSVTKLVETTGSAVVTGGIDTLEVIGKKTMQVLQGEEEGKKRLSALLKEAKEYAEKNSNTNTPANESYTKKKAPQFEALFDDFQGLVHLEALEMLSKQCDMKIQQLLSQCDGEDLDELRETLDQVKEICELPDADDDDDKEESTAPILRTKLLESVKDMGIQLQFDPIVNCWEKILSESQNSLDESTDDEIEEIVRCRLMELAENTAHEAITNLAQSSALSVQLLHRSTALLSVRERRSTADEADGLTQLTAVLTSHISEIATLYSQKLNKISNKYIDSSKINELITDIFLEAGKGSSYIQDAFMLTIPILQVGAT